MQPLVLTDEQFEDFAPQLAAMARVLCVPPANVALLAGAHPELLQRSALQVSHSITPHDAAHVPLTALHLPIVLLFKRPAGKHNCNGAVACWITYVPHKLFHFVVSGQQPGHSAGFYPVRWARASGGAAGC